MNYKHFSLVLLVPQVFLVPFVWISNRIAIFLPNIINGQVQDVRDIASVEQVIYGTDFKNGSQLNPNDWAIMKINKPLGRKYGYLGTKSLPSSTLIRNQKKYFFVGYSGDFPSAKYQQYFSLIPYARASKP